MFLKSATFNHEWRRSLVSGGNRAKSGTEDPLG